jgi:hypothetical protein
LAYAQLAAHALGLGSSWSGGINTAAQFLKVPARKPLNVAWR